MTKALMKYLLSLCILLLSGYGHLYAQPHQEGTTHPLKGVVHAASIGTLQHDLAAILKVSKPSAEKERNNLYSTESEKEEDESLSFHKIVDNTHFIAAVFYAHALALLLSVLARVLHFCKHFSYFSSHRLYLIFRVFRI
jgi:hypothetical protein